MRKISGKAGTAVIATSAALLAIAGFSGAQAAGLIDSAAIKDNSIQTNDVKDGALTIADLRESAIQRLQGSQGAPGAKGDKGDSGLTGAYYSVAYYNAGQTNAGAIATVACDATTDVAISGGVQVLGLDEGANSRNTPVSSSFPGRMNWDATPPAPRADRLDGWIVQFGGNAGEVSDKAPNKTKIWALCVPGANIPVKQTYLESADD